MNKMGNLMNSPIVMFVYNRPDTTSEVLSALASQTTLPTEVIVYADGPKNADDFKKTEAVKNLITSINWTNVELIQRSSNLGSASNILQGLDQVFQDYHSALIVEDDVKPARHFYEALSILLERYESEDKVFSVGGYPSLEADALPDYPFDVIFSPRFNVWGWGTWADRWHDVSQKLHNYTSPFNRAEDVPTYAGADMPDALRSMQDRTNLFIGSALALICLRAGFLHALTRHYLINNIGLDSGIHGQATPGLRLFVEKHNKIVEKIPSHFPPDVLLRDDVCEGIQIYIIDIYEQGQPVKSWYQPLQTLIKRVFTKFRQFGRRLIMRNETTKPDPNDYSAILGQGNIVPCQIEAYFLALNEYVNEGDSILDVGFGLGYGLNILAIKADEVSGVDIDSKVYDYCQNTLVGRNPRLKELALYDGYSLDYEDDCFNILTCVDVLEHVEDYDRLLREMVRVSRRGVLISTPNRRDEYTNLNGTPKNFWHLREWSYEELEDILSKHGQVDWNFLNGPYEGPFTHSKIPAKDTITLTPFIYK